MPGLARKGAAAPGQSVASRSLDPPSQRGSLRGPARDAWEALGGPRAGSRARLASGRPGPECRVPGGAAPPLWSLCQTQNSSKDCNSRRRIQTPRAIKAGRILNLGCAGAGRRGCCRRLSSRRWEPLGGVGRNPSRNPRAPPPPRVRKNLRNPLGGYKTITVRRTRRTLPAWKPKRCCRSRFCRPSGHARRRTRNLSCNRPMAMIRAATSAAVHTAIQVNARSHPSQSCA